MHKNHGVPDKTPAVYADDCSLTAHNHEDIQAIVDRFSDDAKKFGLTISIKRWN